MGKEKKLINFYLEVDLIEKFEKECKSKHRNKSNMMEFILDEYFSREDKIENNKN